MDPPRSTPISAVAVTRSFGGTTALSEVSLAIASGEVRALLGPNGAGKTTLLRILAGLIDPSAGEVLILGKSASLAGGRQAREQLGFVPSGDRTTYLRLTGLENLIFFARLHGLSRRAAKEKALALLDHVGLGYAADRRTGLYSHGMVKRLSVARALLMDPQILFVDEATHDLDPDGARRVRELVRAAAERGAAVIWATQRLDEIRGFADTATVLEAGRVRFDGTVVELSGRSPARRFLIRVQDGLPAVPLPEHLGLLTAATSHSREHFILELAPEGILGDALLAVAGSGARILSCREERSDIEDAFFDVMVGA